MIKHLTLLLIFSCIATIAKAQKTDTAVFKKAYKIIIKTDRPMNENFIHAGSSLLDNGWIIESTQQQFGQIISEPIKSYWGYQVIYIIAKNYEIDIFSKARGSLATYSPLLYDKSDSNKEEFDNMIKLAKSIGGKITYSE